MGFGWRNACAAQMTGRVRMFEQMLCMCVHVWDRDRDLSTIETYSKVWAYDVLINSPADKNLRKYYSSVCCSDCDCIIWCGRAVSAMRMMIKPTVCVGARAEILPPSPFPKEVATKEIIVNITFTFVGTSITHTHSRKLSIILETLWPYNGIKWICWVRLILSRTKSTKTPMGISAVSFHRSIEVE